MPVRNTDEYRDLAVEQLRESPTNHAVLCLATGAEGRTTATESGLVWDAKSDAIRGAMRCP